MHWLDGFVYWFVAHTGQSVPESPYPDRQVWHVDAPVQVAHPAAQPGMKVLLNKSSAYKLTHTQVV